MSGGSGASSPFLSRRLELYIHLLPAHLGDVQNGVNEKLNLMLLRYSDVAGGVVVAYSDVEIVQSHGRIMYDMPHIHFHVRATMLVFAPKVTSRLVGTVTKVGPDHIGLLVYGLFNASVAAEHIRSEFQCIDGASWHSRKTGEVVEIGTDLLFEVKELHTVNGIMSVRGSMEKAGTGPTAVPDAAAPQTPHRSSSKRSRSQPASVEPPRIREERRASPQPADAAEESTPPESTPRKKRRREK